MHANLPNTHADIKSQNHIFSIYRTNNTKPNMDFTSKNTKPAAISVATNASTPGAAHVGASSARGQQAFQKTKDLTEGPKYFMEDHQLQQLPSTLEQESMSSKRGAGKSHDEKSDEKWKQSGQAKKKTTQSHSMDAVVIADEKSKRRAARKERIVSRSPLAEDQKEEVEQYQDVENLTPGAVQVSGMYSMDSTGGDKEDGRTRIDNDSSRDLQYKTNREESARISRMIIEAQLVREENTAQLAQYEREQIQQETRQEVLGEIGEVAQAEVVEDDGSQTRRRTCLCACTFVILLAIILGSVLGTRDNSSNTISVPETTTPTISPVPSETPSTTPSLRPSLSMKPSQIPTAAPLNNSICEEAHIIGLGGAAIEASLQDATEQVVVFCEFPDQQPSDSQPGLWYKVRG